MSSFWLRFKPYFGSAGTLHNAAGFQFSRSLQVVVWVTPRLIHTVHTTNIFSIYTLVLKGFSKADDVCFRPSNWSSLKTDNHANPPLLELWLHFFPATIGPAFHPLCIASPPEGPLWQLIWQSELAARCPKRWLLCLPRPHLNDMKPNPMLRRTVRYLVPELLVQSPPWMTRKKWERFHPRPGRSFNDSGVAKHVQSGDFINWHLCWRNYGLHCDPTVTALRVSLLTTARSPSLVSVSTHPHRFPLP
jgi:hypothetical protein